MPEEAATIPLSLKYAAATNILLSELKLDDNLKDECAVACCAGCIGACFERACTNVCNTMWYNMEEGKMWPWLVIGGIIVGITALIVFV